ncbi:pesticin C-terminus-like muramidase [Aliarcobacter skirrowii]|uniref:Pesticin C-terminus-like muramidase n=1 Tax=Aliarcobacter skirrowii TaxID=28200 RepID=A0AAW9DCC1_9BACT|nr:pesticin C-terminus-like muramidase [Aliarcobacter skirrowii]MDX4069895.1 pesticin C-terminus-like muramidase [Aliarcobacter skirrowii]
MAKRIDEKMLLRAEPILEKNKTIDDLENIKIEMNLLDKDRKTLTSKPLEKTIPKAEKTEDIKDILKKYNSTFNGKYIIKDITSAKEVAKQLEIEETDEKYNQISYLSFRIDANCSGKFDKSEAEKWFDVEITSCSNKINFDFIHSLEGFKLIGYVPDVDESNSGVTIASGFDIGARSKQDLINLGFDNKLIEKLSPYCSKKKYDALNFLNQNPLEISKQEASIINKKVKEEAITFIKKIYNSNSSINFFCLPEQAQTVIASVSFQYGNLPSKTPKFWNYAINQEWENMIKELNDFGDNYTTRRQTEANYLKGILQ